MFRFISFTCGALALGLVACGSSDDEGNGSTGMDGGAGTAGTGGSATGGSAGSTQGGTGGTAGATGGTTTTGGTGGTTGGTGGTTGGTGGTVATGGSGGTVTPPSDGSQLSTCTTNADCDMGLACYVFGGYCSQTCTMDSDCSTLTDATYTCYIAGGIGGATSGVCRIECTSADDTSCPQGMTCVDVGGMNFRCAYSQGATGSTPVYGQCQTTADCATGLTCTAFGGGTGYCTEPCMADTDCTAPTSGTVTATCGNFGLCTLDCSMAMDGCPDTMTCQTSMFGGGLSFCNY